jgi:hypothetical protein
MLLFKYYVDFLIITIEVSFLNGKTVWTYCAINKWLENLAYKTGANQWIFTAATKSPLATCQV